MTTMIEVVVVEGVGQAHQKVPSQYPSIPVNEDLVSYDGSGGSNGLGCLTRARSSLTLLSSVKYFFCHSLRIPLISANSSIKSVLDTLCSCLQL